MTKSPKATSQMKQSTSLLVIFGLGEDKRPHAARFPLSEEQTVRKAAGLMGFQFVRTDTDTLRALAARLPAGQIFGTGRALVPYVKEAVYSQLLTQTRPENGATAGQGTAPAGATEQHQPVTRPDATDVRQVLGTTALVGLTIQERQRLLGLWPSKDHKVPEFCSRLVELWEAVWLPAVRGGFGARAKPFTYADFDARDITFFAPTVFKCWQQRWLWGVWAINGRFQLWTGLQCAADNRSIMLLFDLTTTEDERHPKFDAAALGKDWQFRSARHFSAFVTKQQPVPAQINSESSEIKQLKALAEAPVAVAAKLLATPSPASPSRSQTVS